MEIVMFCAKHCLFLLTPLREGRRSSTATTGRTNAFLLTPLREGRPELASAIMIDGLFLLTPLREGRPVRWGSSTTRSRTFLLTPLREGRQSAKSTTQNGLVFLLTPLREGRQKPARRRGRFFSDFYSRPCGRGDTTRSRTTRRRLTISTHAPAGGATCAGVPTRNA